MVGKADVFEMRTKQAVVAIGDRYKYFVADLLPCGIRPLANLGMNSPVMGRETGSLVGHRDPPSRRRTNTMLDTALMLSNTDRFKTHQRNPHLKRFRSVQNEDPEIRRWREQDFPRM